MVHLLLIGTLAEAQTVHSLLRSLESLHRYLLFPAACAWHSAEDNSGGVSVPQDITAQGLMRWGPLVNMQIPGPRPRLREPELGGRESGV